jgi:hypothetical protein
MNQFANIATGTSCVAHIHIAIHLETVQCSITTKRVYLRLFDVCFQDLVAPTG